MKIANLQKVKSVFFVGIGGIGISAIARMMLLEGKKVVGSDRSMTLVTDELKKAGAKVFVGHDAKNIPKDCDLVIYTVAIPKDNPELVEAKVREIPMLTYPEALGLISKDKFTIAISGTSGKTTTTAMVAKVLIDAGLDPTVIVGSLLLDQKSNFIAGKSKPARLNGRSVGYLVVEADEYKRAFHNLEPSILAINNITPDHLDYFKDLADIQDTFNHLAKKVGEGGVVVCDVDDAGVKPAIKNLTCRLVDSKKHFDNNLHLKVPGEHNRANAAVARAIGEVVGIPREKINKALGDFSGTWRRFQYKGKTKNGALVYDDYAHNPEKVRAALSGAREHFDGKKIVAIFQPHLYSRTKLLLKEFAKSFNDADELIILPIYAAREVEDKSINSEIFAKAIVKQLTWGPGPQVENKRLKVVSVVHDKVEAISLIPRDANVVITIGAGDVTEVSDTLTKN